MKSKILVALLSLAALSAHASGLDALDNFIKSTKSGRASFTQVVTEPSREGKPGRTRTSTGSFEFARPSRFRFDYKKPFEQAIVADGKTLWVYDIDLNQVTARNQDAVLGSTPATLIASAGSTAALLRDFELEAAPEKDGIQWAVAIPKNRNGQVNRMRVGFRGNELAQLEILDGFGQRSLMTVDKMETNVAIPGERFTFKPPPGASVIRQ